ncbi:MAG TPA: O-antigen ligase family protein [Acidobacteriaceae bacterium]|jgi:O-antigen ligase|nr:O-antigen ligase family protein [Acidobacteriaceae bacterium]
MVCAAIFLFFSIQGSIPGLAPAQAYEVTAGAATAISTISGVASQIVVNGAILLLILRRPRLVLGQIAAVPWLALFALFAVASSAWSLDPLLTLRRSLAFALAALLGLYFAARFSCARQFAILRFTMLTAALATVALVLLDPSLGLDHSAGHATEWQGIFTQKNACGRIMVLATAVLLFEGRLTPFRIACLGLYFFILVRSGSRGAWIVEAAVLLFWIFLGVARRAGPRLRTVLACAAPPCALALAGTAVGSYARLAPFLGRDATLSGRTAIWRQVIHFIGLRPWFGYGYDAFWRGMQGPSLQVSAAVHFVVLHAHNGFLEIALELGSAGLVLFFLSWISAWRQLGSAWRRGELQRLAWPAAVLLLIVLYDLDENTLLIHNGLFWALYGSAAVTAARIARDCGHTATEPVHAILNPGSRKPGARASSIPQEIV